MPHIFVVPPRKRSNVPSETIAPLFSNDDADMMAVDWRSANGYAVTGRHVDKKYCTYYAHRVVLSRMLGRTLSQNEDTDHINGNKIDNRRENLRLATRSENMQNQGTRRDNTSGYRNVKWHAKAKKWRVTIRVSGKDVHGGFFSSITEAAQKAEQMRKEAGFAAGHNA